MTEAGERHALVVASQVHGLLGCHNDADSMADVLGDHHFAIRCLREQTATRAGIIGAYSELIQAVKPGDAVVIYYSGHGSRAGVGGRAGIETRCILPTDIDETGADDFRGILADELSVLQWRLTLRTPNVVTILDCCFSGRISRGAPPGPTNVRGRDERWPARGVAERQRDAARTFERIQAAHPGEQWFDANPYAVRLAACGPHQLAFETSDRAGSWHGGFTRALAAVLRDNPQTTWRAAIEAVQHRMIAQRPFQRPEAEGPTDHVVFVGTAGRSGRSLPIRRDPDKGEAWLDGAEIHDLQVGDTFRIVAAGRDPQATTRTPPVPARITWLVGGAAALTTFDGRPILDGFVAYDDGDQTRDLHARLEGPGAEQVRARLVGISGLLIFEGPPADDIATVTITDAGCVLHDAAGRPLYPRPVPTDAAGLGELRGHLEQLAAAQRLSRLAVADLTEPVSFEVTTRAGGSAEGRVFHPGDELLVSVGYGDGRRQFVYANVLAIGVTASVTVLNRSESSSGIQLARGESLAVGEAPGGRHQPVPLIWPAGLPIAGPREETWVAVFSDTPQDLRSLSQDGVVGEGAGPGASVRPGRRLRVTRDIGVDGLGQASARLASYRVTFQVCPGGPACTHR